LKNEPCGVTTFARSSVETVQDCLDRISVREATVRAWAHVAGDRALEAARRCDAEPQGGALHGVPVGVKDVFDTADQPTAYGFEPYEGFRPKADSAVVARLRSLGMIVLGKTVTTEFASPTPETVPTRNPLDTARSAGFSSSGSAAAVADGMVPLAIGTQTGASVIRPAAYCGIYGYKPSLDAIDPAGLRHAKPSIDTIGLFAQTLPDMLVFADGFGLRPEQAPEPQIRIGLCRTRHWEICGDAMKAALLDAADALARGGAVVTDLALPQSLDSFDASFDTVMAAEHAASLAVEYNRWRDDLHPWNRVLVEKGRRISKADYCEAQVSATEFRADFRRLFDEIDVILTPSAKGVAPPAAETVVGPWFRDWTFLHGPCLSLPRAREDDGLPLGLQLVGPPDGDARFLAVARWVDNLLLDRQ
jgi:amidase